MYRDPIKGPSYVPGILSYVPHITLYYKGPSYVLYIRWTLIKNYILYTKGPSYVNSL